MRADIGVKFHPNYFEIFIKSLRLVETIFCISGRWGATLCCQTEDYRRLDHHDQSLWVLGQIYRIMLILSNKRCLSLGMLQLLIAPTRR